MPDISMCHGGDCPLKNNCYRFTAKPSEYQSYYSIPPYEEKIGCDRQWELTPQKPLRKPKLPKRSSKSA